MPTFSRYTGFEWPGASVSPTGGGLCTGVPGSAPTIITSDSDPLAGASARCIEASGGTNANFQLQMGSLFSKTIVQCVRVKPVTIPGASADSFKVVSCLWFDNGTTGCGVGINPDTGNWDVVDGTGASTHYDSGIAATTGVWHTIEAYVDSNANPWVLRVIINGVRQTDRNVALATSNMNAYVSFFNHGNSTATMRFDNYWQSTTAADFGYGAVPIEGIVADQTAAAEHQSITTTEWQYTDNTFTGATNFTGNSETDSRSRINSLDAVTAIRMNKTTAITGNGRWPIADPLVTSRVPLSVCWVGAVREGATSATSNAIFRSLLGASTTDHFNGDPSWGTTLNYLRSQMDTKPGGGAWTLQDVKDLKFEADSTDASPNPWLGGFVYEIAWGPGAPVPINPFLNYRKSAHLIGR